MGVQAEGEQPAPTGLGGVHISGHTPGGRPSSFASVEQHSLLDIGQAAKQFPDDPQASTPARKMPISQNTLKVAGESGSQPSDDLRRISDSTTLH